MISLVPLPQPSCSLDLVTIDFHLFQRWTCTLKGYHFNNVFEIQGVVDIHTSLTENDFNAGLQKRQPCLDRWILAKGDSFKGDDFEIGK